MSDRRGQESFRRAQKQHNRAFGATGWGWAHEVLTAREVAALELALALLKRGFVSFPRLMIDYGSELYLDYDLLGKLLVLMCEPEVAGQDISGLGQYRIELRHPDRYHKFRERLSELAEEDVVRFEEGPGAQELTFDFYPLLSRLRALVLQHEESTASAEAAAAADPVPPAVTRPDVAAAAAPGTGASFLDQVQIHAPLLRYAQERLGRPLSDREVADIIDWVTTYGFDDRVVKAIVDEGVERGVTRFSYLNQIARRWHEEGIRSLDDAERERADYRRLMTRWGRVVSHLGLSRRLTRAEQKLLEKWSGEWGFPEEVILRACDETIYTNEPNFAYIDRVLEGWRAKGVRTLADVERLARDHQRQRAAGSGGAARGPARTPAGEGQRPSNVILRRGERKDDEWYEQFVKKPK